MTPRFSPNHAPLRRAFAFALLFAAGSAGAADFYVNASAAAGGDGSQAAPFATIKAAVEAANGVSGPSTIHIASGTYAIASASDFVTVSVPDLTITAVDPANKPVVALDANLSTVQNNPVVFSVPVGSDRLTVANLQFAYSYAGDKNVAGNSFGESGKLFSFAANDCVFDGCEFVQTGTGRNWKDGGVLYADSSEQLHAKQGTGLIVRNCRFDHVGASTFRPIKFADNSQIVGNLFDSCSGYFTVHKQSTGGYFVSNRVMNCTQPIKSKGDNYGEIANGEIAYNVFVGSDVAFFQKDANAGYAGQPRFHHNTVVGCSGFVQVDEVNKLDAVDLRQPHSRFRERLHHPRERDVPRQPEEFLQGWIVLQGQRLACARFRFRHGTYPVRRLRPQPRRFGQQGAWGRSGIPQYVGPNEPGLLPTQRRALSVGPDDRARGERDNRQNDVFIRCNLCRSGRAGGHPGRTGRILRARRLFDGSFHEPCPGDRRLRRRLHGQRGRGDGRLGF